MSDRDYYEALGLTPLADGAMVDQAYWHLARKYQSLAASHPSAHRMLDELNEAYGVLGNPLLRREYDAFRDDVLLTSGALRPVPSKPKRRKRAGALPAQSRGRTGTASQLGIKKWRWYGVAAIIAGLAYAGSWQGVNPIFVISALVAGLALSLTPALKRQLPSLKISVPAMPSVSLPDVKASRLAFPRLPETATLEIDDQLDADELRVSTAAIIERWRKSMGLRTDPAGSADEPSRTLVEIVEGERDLDSDSEPLTTVMEILRGAKKAPEASEQTAPR